MIPKECKRLAEVDFPIAEVSRHADCENRIRSRHPKALHLWWARRPLASSRAILMALLLPDPCDESCPPEFKNEARKILGSVRQRPSTDEELRKALLWFIGAFASWKMASNPAFLRVAQALVAAAHLEETPLVADPFSGGGSIPFEALRLGCDAFASDLNPVACLILKVLLENKPREGAALVEQIRQAGERVREKAVKELAAYYPADPDGARPITYLWARTVRCEAPNCGAEIPLMRSMWLCKKPNRKQALRAITVRPKGEVPRVEFEIFEPSDEKEVQGGTVANARATCVCCNSTLSAGRVRIQLSKQRGGADVIFNDKGTREGGARMTAVVVLKPGETGRHYRLPNNTDYAAVNAAQTLEVSVFEDWERSGKRGPCPVPNEPISRNELRRISVPLYGMNSWGDIYSARQKVSLMKLSNLVRSIDGDAARESVALALSKLSELSCSLCAWEPIAECTRHVFGRQAIGMAWDFGEGVPISSSSGSFEVSLSNTISALEGSGSRFRGGTVQQADANHHPLPDQSASIWFTDPPYYDAVPYAHLADFFFIWLRRALPDGQLFGSSATERTIATPKNAEIVVDRPHRLSKSTKDTVFYETAMGKAFAEGRRILSEAGIGSVVFAHKTTEGWEALLSGMIVGGWTITGSWPIATEMGSRLNARDTASLATSVHLICRPRPKDAAIGDWAGVLRELPKRVASWIERLQDEGIRGADLVFACIGPALEIFSRYSSVETAEGRGVGLPEYLEKVWEVVGRAALERVLGNGETTAGALEEDARLTALFLWALQSTKAPDEAGDPGEEDEDAVAKVAAKGFSLPYDVVRRFAQPMGIDLDAWTNRIIGQEKGVVRMLPVRERAKALFGEEGVGSAASWIDSDVFENVQGLLFPDAEPAKANSGRGKRAIIGNDVELQSADATTLDRVHAAMLLQQSGQANALRKLLESEQDRGPEFLRLANALSALYPRGAEEKRLLDAMLLAVPR